MTQARELYVTGSDRTKHLMHLDASCVVDNEEGQTVVDAHGHFVSARLPVAERLTADELAALGELCVAWAKRGRFTFRGEAHAAVCANFVMGGLKGDQDTCLAMPSSRVAESDKEQLAYLNIMNRLRSALRTSVLSRVEKYFYSLIDCVRDDMHARGLRYTYLDYFTSISLGDLFMPRTHVDDDAWITFIVALGDCELGGGFAHPACGVVHAVHAGDILVVNPAHGHCTSEFGDALATRKMIAIFVSDNAFRACMTSHEVAQAHGLAEWHPHGKKRKHA
jgi:hypothetical protein